MRRILVFTGDGKGKTTAALGMALRAVGHGMPVAVCQFIKSREDLGELRGLSMLPAVRVGVWGAGFVPAPHNPRFQKHVKAAARAWRWAQVALQSPAYRMVVLDEICGALSKGLIPLEPVLEALKALPEDKLVACTGRNAPEALLELADTATEMTLIKHAFQQGISAMPGVEK